MTDTHLKLPDSEENQLAIIDLMWRMAEKYGLWVVVSDKCPIPCDDAEVAKKRAEVFALLHCARIGVIAAHGNLNQQRT